MSRRPAVAARLALAVLTAAGASPTVASAAATSFAQEASGEAGWATRVDALFQDRFSGDVPGCAVGVLVDGQLRYARGFGKASLEWGEPITALTRMRVGSVSKQFTGFVVARLAEEGRIDPEASIRDYLPELSEAHQDVRVADVVHHISGIRDYGTYMFLTGSPFSDRSSEDRVAHLIASQTALNFPPGTDMVYSNSGYLLLARMVDRVTGTPLQELLRSWIFEPLGMHETVVHSAFDMVIPRFASAYLPAADTFVRNVPTSMIRGAAGVVTTLRDLSLWEAAMQDPPADWRPVVDRMHRAGQLRDGGPVDYGYGLYLLSQAGLPTVFHGGSFASYRSIVLRFPEERVSGLLLCNRGDIQPRTEILAVLREVLGDRMDAPPSRTATAAGPGSEAPEPVTGELAAALVGRYAFRAIGAEVEFARNDDGALVLHLAGERTLPVTRSTRGADVVEADTGFMPLVLRLEQEGSRVVGFRMDFFRERDLPFERVDIGG